MKINEAKKLLKEYLKVKCEAGERKPALFLKGPPGIGKSAIVNQIGEELGIKVVTLIASTKNPVDIEGIPFRDGKTGQVRWERPYFLPQDGEGILFVDEINAVPKSMQVTLYGLVLEGKVGEHSIGDGWIVICAGNREEDMAVVYKESSALVSRKCTILIDPDVDAWKAWAYDAGVVPEIIAFLTDRPELIYKAPKNLKAKNFPTPRGYAMASWFIKHLGSKTARETVEGCIGEGASAELYTYMEVYNEVPDLQAILEGKISPKLPNKPSVVYAVMSGLVSYCSASGKKEHTMNAFKYAKDCMDTEWQVAMLKEFNKSGKVWDILTKSKEFADFASKNREVFQYDE